MAVLKPLLESEVSSGSFEGLREAASEGLGLFTRQVEAATLCCLLVIFIISADLKVENILVGIEDPSVLQDFARAQSSNPMARKTKDGHHVYLSHNDFGEQRSHPIQPDEYRAPEVILGAGWTYSADIWNLGLLMWNLLENRDLFSTTHDGRGKYSPAVHLVKMIALLSPPPKELITREREGLTWKWAPAAHNTAGEMCNTASEWFGGPFFNENDLIPHNPRIEDTVSTLEGGQKEQFLAFAKNILRWLPDDRKTAKELIGDPWLSEDSIKGILNTAKCHLQLLQDIFPPYLHISATPCDACIVR
ncbi:uncharacterized protein N7518_001340 [Penicillium psychrosexuale]|uniref:uncharacterized protein n=1 Tax=Penicillium psychrosexuale TaxID=1002107 RepID=UPI002545890D|nr:uncharacterized protein N7518_001340 [Penicillium psychrosexuale]KAJ5799272.1 hypothetical protein N7518_001340 [Penicillium psychrosexuale]